MSKTLEARWYKEGIGDLLATTALEPRLDKMVRAPFVRKAGCLLLEPLAAHATTPEAFQDRTGYEAFVNRIHVDDLIDVDPAAAELRQVLLQQGAKAAVELAARLEKEGNYRVLLSVDADAPALTVRFVERRPGEPWGAEDPDAYQLEDVLMIDTRA